MKTELTFSTEEKRIEMKGLKIVLKKEDDAEAGISTLIVFIAMVLIAAIAASVIIETASSLQSQAERTGRETIGEVSIGVKILDICGQYGTRVVDGTSYSRIHNMTITITPRAGSKNIDLSEMLLILTDGTTEHVLRTNSTLPVFADSSSNASIFEKPARNHPEMSTIFDLPSDQFGIIVVKDYDNTCNENMPAINKADKVMLTVNLTALFNGIPERAHILGRVVSEEGIVTGIIDFITPAGFQNTIIDLQ